MLYIVNNMENILCYILKSDFYFPYVDIYIFTKKIRSDKDMYFRYFVMQLVIFLDYFVFFSLFVMYKVIPGE